MSIEVSGPRSLIGLRVVVLCGSSEIRFCAMRDAQNLLDKIFEARGLVVRTVDLHDWSLSAVPRLLKEIARQEPDIILMQYPTRAFGHSLGPVVLSLVQTIAPSMIMLHEFVAAHPLRKAAVGALLLRANRVGMTAERERHKLLRWNPWLRRRIHMVPIASNIPGRPWAPVHPRTVVYFGQLRAEKGIESFFSCCDLIRKQVPEAAFEIVGSIVPNQEAYAAYVRAEAAARAIAVISNLEPDNVGERLAAASVALLPFPDGASLRRGSLLAAAACGVPVATTIGPDTPPELIPYLVPTRDVQSLSALVVTALTNEEARNAMHEQSVELDRWNGMERTADHYLRAFSDLLAAQGAVADEAAPVNGDVVR